MTKQECIDLLIESGHREYEHNKYCKDGSYVLRYGEYTRPTYRILKYRGQNDYYIKVKYFFCNGTMNAPQNGPLSYEEIESLKMIAVTRRRKI